MAVVVVEEGEADLVVDVEAGVVVEGEAVEEVVSVEGLVVEVMIKGPQNKYLN